MYKHYYINKNSQDSWENEVHTEDCSYFSDIKDKEYLWYFDNCKDAIKKAKENYSDVDWCYWCIKECHNK